MTALAIKTALLLWLGVLPPCGPDQCRHGVFPYECDGSSCLMTDGSFRSDPRRVK